MLNKQPPSAGKVRSIARCNSFRLLNTLVATYASAEAIVGYDCVPLEDVNQLLSAEFDSSLVRILLSIYVSHVSTVVSSLVWTLISSVLCVHVHYMSIMTDGLQFLTYRLTCLARYIRCKESHSWWGETTKCATASAHGHLGDICQPHM